MRIARVELFPVRIARTTGFRNVHVIVRLETGDGAVGWGEMSDLSHAPLYALDLPALERTLAEALAGRDPRDVNALDRTLLGLFPDEGHMYSRSGSIRQGVDLALHDLVGRAQGVPAHALLGGKLRDGFPVCFPIFRLRSRDDVPDRLERVAEAAGHGFRLIRLYAGVDLDADEAFLSAFAERFGETVGLKSLDFSNLLGWRRALAAAQRLSAVVEPALVESPAPRGDLEGLAELRRRSPWPVSEHVHGPEHAWLLLRAGAVDILNVSPYVLGGMRACLRVGALADAAHAGVLVGTTQELLLGTAAAAHAGAALRTLDYASDTTGPLLYTEDVCRPFALFRDGELRVPDAPGLGPVVDEEALRTRPPDLDWSSVDLAGVIDRTVPKEAPA